MRVRGLLCAGLLAVLALVETVSADPLPFFEGFENLVGGGQPLDKNPGVNNPTGANLAPNGSGQPWFGPAPPNARVVGPDSTNGPTVTPHSGTQMIRGTAPSDLDQNWVNLAYRFNGGNRYTGLIMLDFWFYDPLGSGGATFRDYAAIGFYNTAPGDTDYPGTGSLNTGVSQIQRISLGAASVQPAGFDVTKYQARVVGATDGYSAGWINLSLTRSVGWHHARISIGPALPDNTNEISFYIDDLDTPLLTHNSVTTFGYNVIELNTNHGATTGYFDDITFDVLPPTGACCTGYSCSVVTQAACTGDGGSYLGDGVACADTSCCNEPFADSDGDLDVDMDDFGAFQACYSGTGAIPTGDQFPYPCACFDTDTSASVDLADFTAFRLCATGPAIPWVSTLDCP